MNELEYRMLDPLPGTANWGGTALYFELANQPGKATFTTPLETLPARIKCGYCGTKNKLDNSRCERCGAPVE